MFKVRIKTSPEGGLHKSTGQQEGYGLVRNLNAMQTSPDSVPVNDKMGAIPRDQANIEVEGGESVIGDVNKDGTMELMHFTGKRHTEGGVPVNIPEGSFIYSDTKNLTIKDPEILEKLFNLPARKQGYTPAEISRKYDINMYVEILKDETADPLAKRSAAEMLKKNKQKLGLLAFIQESMKGFPDGIPAIAEDVLASMGIDPNQMAQQFAPQQPQQGMMPPPQEGQGIPMSEDESAMQGMMPQGPAVAPEDVANQMQGKFGGTMPKFPVGGESFFDMVGRVYGNTNNYAPSACTLGYVYNSYIKECVLPHYKNVKQIFQVPYEGFQSNEQEWQSVPSVAPAKKAPTAADKKAQNLFDNSFKITGGPSKYEKAQAEQAKAIEDYRKKTGYYEKIKDLRPDLTRKVLEGTATPEEEKLVRDASRAILGINTEQGHAEEKIIYDIDKKYGTLSQEQIAKQKREEDARAEGFESYADKYNKQKKYKNSIPGFGDKSNLEEYMNSGSGQFVAGDTFYKALLSGDPSRMIAAADDIKDIDVDWSVGWLPWTDQDKVDDMYSILHDEAYQILNEREKEKLQKYYKPEEVLKKADDLIKDFEVKAREATDIKTKKYYADQVAKYKRYKEYLKSPGHDNWRKKVNSSRVVGENLWWLPVPGIGTPIQDEAVIDSYGYPTDFLFNETEILGFNLGQDDVAEETDALFTGPRYKTYLELYDEITKGHDVLKKTNISATAPLANKGLTHTNERQGFLNWSRPDIIGNVRTINKIQNPSNSPKDAKGYAQEYYLKAAPGSTFTMGKNVDGQMVWFQIDENGAENEVSNAEWVKTLNAAATQKEKRTVALPPAKVPLDAIQLLEQEQKLNPKLNVTPIKKQQTEKKSSNGPVVPVGNQPAKPKYENGFSDQDIDKYFGSGGMQFGGTMPSVGSNITIGDKVFRYGGLINENGKLRYDRGGSVLPKYDNAGTVTGGTEPVKSEVKVVTDPNRNGGKPMNTYTLTYKSKNGDTVVQVIEDQATGNILARRNTVTNQSIPNGVPITRSSYDYITKDNLNEYEKKELAEKWNNDVSQYLTYLNTSQEMRRNKDFRKDLHDQYKKDIAADNSYTKRATGKSKYNADLAGMDEETMINELLAFEERNARLKAFGFDSFTSQQNTADQEAGRSTGTHGAYVNAKAQQLINSTPGLADLDFSKGYRGQAGYIAYNNLLTNNPTYKANNMANPQYGVSDEDIGKGKSTVSGIDNWNTNTTLGQRLGWHTTPPPPETKPGEKNTFYCVEYSDGTKETKTVSYKEGEQPVAPSGEVNGKTVTKATQYETADDATKNCMTDPKIPPGKKPIPQPTTWFAPDIVNYAANMRQIIPNTPPVLRQMNAAYSGYDTINPITRIAGITGLMRQQQDLAMNTMDPTVGFAAMAGQGYDQLGQQIADVEEGNATKIVNPYLQTIGQLNTDVDYKNTLLRGKFDTEGATYQEELANQRNKKAAQDALLWGQGFGNVQKDNALRVMYPNAWHAQRLQPTFAWSGVGKDPLASIDTSVTPGATASTQTDCATVYTEAYNQVKNDTTMDEDAKKEYASNMQKSCISQNLTKANSQMKTQQQLYAQNFIQRFGGTTYTAPGTMEFGGAYFDDY